MKKLIALATLVLLTSCGKDISVIETFKTQDFEGFYFCDNQSSLELLVDFNNRVTFETSGQSLNTVNPVNDTLGTHPTIGERDLLMANNKLIVTPRNYNYNSATHDIEEDVGGSDINGNRRTDLEVVLVKEKEVNITISIFANAVNSNVNNVVVKRTINCKK